MDKIVIKNFAKKFGEKVVHRDINLSIKEGECLGLLGGSGAGKSVILRSIIGLERPDSGEINVLGSDISKKSEKQLVDIRKKVAYVFQNGALFDSMSVYENLAYSLREHTNLKEKEIYDKISNLLDDFGLPNSQKLYPSELSGGMQKRVGMARSIILRPEVVLYDEPTAGLDPYNTLKLQEMILKLKKRGATSIFVTHDMPSAFAVCDRIALIQDGKIREVCETDQIGNGRGMTIKEFIDGKID